MAGQPRLQRGVGFAGRIPFSWSNASLGRPLTWLPDDAHHAQEYLWPAFLPALPHKVWHHVENLRSFDHVAPEHGGRIAWVVGSHGSGKTTALSYSNQDEAPPAPSLKTSPNSRGSGTERRILLQARQQVEGRAVSALLPTTSEMRCRLRHSVAANFCCGRRARDPGPAAVADTALGPLAAGRRQGATSMYAYMQGALRTLSPSYCLAKGLTACMRCP